MENEELRAELEAAFGEFWTAVAKKKFKAFLKCAFFGEPLSDKEKKKAFKEDRENYILMVPDPSELECVAIEKLPDELVAYVYVCDRPYVEGTKMVSARIFREQADRWWVSAVRGGFQEFVPVPGEDLTERALRELDKEPGCWLPHDIGVRRGTLSGGYRPELTEEEKKQEQRAGWDLETRGEFVYHALECKLAVTLNGVRLKYEGGSDDSHWLTGFKSGHQPGEPWVLTVGENRIEVEIDWIQPIESGLTFEIVLDNDAPVFRLHTKQEDKTRYEAVFVIPGSPTFDVPQDAVELVALGDSE